MTSAHVAEIVVRLAPYPVFTVKSYRKDLMTEAGSDDLEHLHADTSTESGPVTGVNTAPIFVAEPGLTIASGKRSVNPRASVNR